MAKVPPAPPPTYYGQGATPLLTMVRVPQLDDAAELGGFTTACEAMGLQVSEREQLLQCMAGLLHLGNVEFDDGSGAATLTLPLPLTPP